MSNSMIQRQSLCIKHDTIDRLKTEQRPYFKYWTSSSVFQGESIISTCNQITEWNLRIFSVFLGVYRCCMYISKGVCWSFFCGISGGVYWFYLYFRRGWGGRPNDSTYISGGRGGGDDRDALRPSLFQEECSGPTWISGAWYLGKLLLLIIWERRVVVGEDRYDGKLSLPVVQEECTSSSWFRLYADGWGCGIVGLGGWGLLVSRCFKPSQPQRITSRLKTNFNLSPSYLFHKPLYHKSFFLKPQLKFYP